MTFPSTLGHSGLSESRWRPGMRANFGPLFERLSIMKRIMGTAVGICLLAASQVVAQTPEKQAVETTTKQTLPGVTLKTETQSVSGTVKEYEVGKKIKLSGPDDKSYSFDLGENARVEGKIVVGQMATVKYTKGTDGKETVAVVSEATANAVTAAAAPKMHSESITKSSGPAATTKTKTETVIGVVKEYEAGKSIKVTGPKTKNYSFDLTDMVALKTEVSVGERVKVTFTKSDNGDKATTIVAYPRKA
jgi:uncharacterized OB-fold protein